MTDDATGVGPKTQAIGGEKMNAPHVEGATDKAVLGYESPGGTKKVDLRALVFKTVTVIFCLFIALAIYVQLMMRREEHMARETAAITDVIAIANALDAFHIDCGRYPTSSEGLLALIQPRSSNLNWQGPYMSKSVLPIDPWSHPYVYVTPSSRPGQSFDLYFLGHDGVAGTSDDVEGK